MSQSHRPQAPRRRAVSRRPRICSRARSAAGGLPGLQAVGEADADDDEAGGGDQDDLVAGAGAPAAQQRLDRLQHRHLSAAVRQAVHGGEHAARHPAGRAPWRRRARRGRRAARRRRAPAARVGQVGGQRRMGRDDAGVRGAPAGGAGRGCRSLSGISARRSRARRTGRSDHPRGQPREAFELGPGTRQDLGALPLDVERGEADEAGQEHREGSRHGEAQPPLGLDRAADPARASARRWRESNPHARRRKRNPPPAWPNLTRGICDPVGRRGPRI